AIVLESKDERPSGRRLKPVSVMVGGVVEADPGMKAADAEREPIIGRVLQQYPLDVDGKGIVVVRLEDDLADDVEVGREPRREEQVDLADGERVDDVAVAKCAEVDVVEAAYLQVAEPDRREHVMRRFGGLTGDRCRGRLVGLALVLGCGLRLELLHLLLELVDALLQLLDLRGVGCGGLLRQRRPASHVNRRDAQGDARPSCHTRDLHPCRFRHQGFSIWRLRRTAASRSASATSAAKRWLAGSKFPASPSASSARAASATRCADNALALPLSAWASLRRRPASRTSIAAQIASMRAG